MFTYKDAGVDIDKVRRLHKRFSKMLSKTFDPHVIYGLGHYAGLYSIGDQVLAIHTDGVGTKILIAEMLKRFDTIGIDCIAMNVNDVICVGAKPLVFVDYLALRKLDYTLVKEITKGLIKGAKEAGISIVGGETAVIPDMLAGDDQAFDLAGSVVGIVKKEDLILGDRIKIGDAIIGLSSNGLHSNGYTLVRKVLLKHYRLDEKVDGLKTNLGEELLKPTKIYVKPVMKTLEKYREHIHGMAHITGGAFSKLTRLSPYKFVIKLDKINPIFNIIKKHANLDDREMFRTFNMGIGFCMVVDSNYKEEIVGLLNEHKLKSYVIGSIEKGKGVYINGIRIDK